MFCLFLVVSNQFVATIGQSRPIMYGSDLVSDYELQQFHFHWGPNTSYGSEHTVNGKSFAGEVFRVFLEDFIKILSIMLLVLLLLLQVTFGS